MSDYVYTQRRARVPHDCKMGDGKIEPGEYCYAVTIGGGGLASLKYPDYIHLTCKDTYITMKEKKHGNTNG